MWSAILGIALKLVGFAIGKHQDKKAAYNEYLQFVHQMESRQLASVNLTHADRSQIGELKRKRSLNNDN